jgi:TonB-dependent receptor
LNQYGQSQTSLREGRDFYNDFKLRTHELSYQSRTTYSGQLAGDHNLFNDQTHFDWIFGYSFANKKQPDIRRARYVKTDDETPYQLTIYHVVNPDLLGRIHMNNEEHIYTAGLNVVEKLDINNFKPEIKTGFYAELKDRNFSARNIGFIKSRRESFDLSLPFKSIDSVFMDENINYPNGITVAELTNLSDSYNAANDLYAGYLGVKIPVGKFSAYGGYRLEKNRRELNGFDDTDDTVHIVNDTINLFPSINLTYNLTEKLTFRAGYGKTINRPEFREIAPYSFYDFEENAIIAGNPGLVNCYIDNYELRTEWYPELGDMITLSAFYKKFKDPIEAILTSSGTGWNYKYQNAKQAISKGLELDIRKSLTFIPESDFLTGILYNTTIVFNTSLIASKLETSDEDHNRRDSIRQMQGQAPYIVNLGLYYTNAQGLSVSILYNVVGKHLSFVGDANYAHIYQMPFNDLEILVQKEFLNHWTVKAGMKNILDSKQTRQNIKGDKTVGQDQITRQFQPGRTFNIGLTYSF